MYEHIFKLTSDEGHEWFTCFHFWSGTGSLWGAKGKNHCGSVPSYGHSPFMLQFLMHFILSIRPFSLLVMKIPSLTSLGLRSLREISDGSVYITQNINLCFYYTVDWIQIFTSNRRQLRHKNNDIKENKPQIKCGQLSLLSLFHICMLLCCRPSLTCTQTTFYFACPFMCKQRKRAMCVTRCAQMQDAGARGLSSVCRAGITVGMVPVYLTATSTLGQCAW